MYFRAYFGVPDTFRSPDGTPVNAVRGLVDFIARLVGEYHPTHLVCAWDNDWRPQWRVDLIPSYKAHRVVATVPGPAPDIEEVPDPLEQIERVAGDRQSVRGESPGQRAVARGPAAGIHEAEDIHGQDQAPIAAAAEQEHRSK